MILCRSTFPMRPQPWRLCSDCAGTSYRTWPRSSSGMARKRLSCTHVAGRVLVLRQGTGHRTPVSCTLDEWTLCSCGFFPRLSTPSFQHVRLHPSQTHNHTTTTPSHTRPRTQPPTTTHATTHPATQTQPRTQYSSSTSLYTVFLSSLPRCTVFRRRLTTCCAHAHDSFNASTSAHVASVKERIQVVTNMWTKCDSTWEWVVPAALRGAFRSASRSISWMCCSFLHHGRGHCSNWEAFCARTQPGPSATIFGTCTWQ